MYIQKLNEQIHKPKRTKGGRVVIGTLVNHRKLLEVQNNSETGYMKRHYSKIRTVPIKVDEPE